MSSLHDLKNHDRLKLIRLTSKLPGRNHKYKASPLIDESLRHLIGLFPVLILTFVYFLAIVYQSFVIAALVLSFLFIAAIAFGIAMRNTHRLGILSAEQSRVLNSHFLDTLNSLRSVRALTAEEFVSVRYRQMLSDYAKTNIAIDLTNLIARFGPVLILILGGLVWFLYDGNSKKFSGDLSFFVILILLLMRFFPALGQAVDITLRLIADLKIGHDVNQILERRELWLSKQIIAPSRTKFERIKQISFHDICFSYDPSKPLLNKINFELNAGKSYAIIGPSGTGKSTIIDLLLRFYDPISGKIKINGIDVIEISEADLRSKIMVLEQQARVFNDTVFNNIAFGRKTTLENIRHACQLAAIDEDILKMSNGYFTTINYQGSNISGGQRQRIVLARGLLHNPDILILDEITNGLDDETKRRVLKNLTKEYKERMIVFITHDPFVMENVDVVVNLTSPAVREVSGSDNSWER